MRLDFALLAEAADTSGDGKVHVLGGGFDGIAIPSIGFTAPPFAIVVRLSVDGDEYEDEHVWGLQLVKPDGSEKWIVEQGRLQFAKPLSGRRSQTQAIVRASFKFEELGKYELKVYGDGVHMSTLDMHVVLAGDEGKVQQ